MNIKSLQRRIDKLEAAKYDNVVMAFADYGDDLAELHGRLRADNPLAKILILHWQCGSGERYEMSDNRS